MCWHFIVATLHFQGISKGRQGRDAQNLVKVDLRFLLLWRLYQDICLDLNICYFQVYLANLRLKDVGTDVLITAYEPVMIK